jgi:hypothetical protein
MKALAIHQIVRYLYQKRPREGEIIDYNIKFGYRVQSVYGVSWVKRKNILETEGLYQERIGGVCRSKYNAPDTPVSFSMTLE